MRIGLNGYGRIGQLLTEKLVRSPDLELVAVNDAIQYSFPQVAGISARIAEGLGQTGALTESANGLQWRHQPVRWTNHTRPEHLNWPEVGVDVVVEASRYFSRREMEAQHDHGRITILMTGDLRDSTPDITLVLGINDQRYHPRMSVVCVGSDRTQAICPLMQALVESFGIEAYQLAIHRPPYVWDTAQIVSQPHQPQQTARVIPELHGIGTVFRIDDPHTAFVKMWLDLTTRREVALPEVVLQLRQAAERFRNALYVGQTTPHIAGCTYSAVINETLIKANLRRLWILMECDPVVSYVERLIEILEFVRHVRADR